MVPVLAGSHETHAAGVTVSHRDHLAVLLAVIDNTGITRGEGGFTVVVPALPGCISYGRTLAEAKAMASDAINSYLESLRKHGEPILDDTGVLEEMVTVRCA